ncbi:MAG: 50S ribosomal protein L3 N(5)-glutamine methyltransferase, partial [Comamonas sp.]
MSNTSILLISGNTVAELIASGARALTAAGVAFGHGTATAEDEAAWLVLWKLGLPLDSELTPGAPESVANQPVSLDA